ncbi:hypothetical protein NKI50_27205 [Mesorhizobium sp. M0563]|uniref:hypothetical protein n=1 Tax=Mesorhizobium sp. M0563 TaxID=2956959 RepID=UPI00333A889E
MFFKRAFHALKRATTGQVVRQIDTNIDSLGDMKSDFGSRPNVTDPMSSWHSLRLAAINIALDAVMKAMQEIRAAATELQNLL